jgi:hypothetical protein
MLIHRRKINRLPLFMLPQINDTMNLCLNLARKLENIFVLHEMLGACGQFVEQKLVHSSSFRHDQIHKCHLYDLGSQQFNLVTCGRIKVSKCYFETLVCTDLRILVEGKSQYSSPPCTNSFTSATFEISNTNFFNKTNYHKEKFSCTELSPSVSIPWTDFSALFLQRPTS